MKNAAPSSHITLNSAPVKLSDQVVNALEKLGLQPDDISMKGKRMEEQREVADSIKKIIEIMWEEGLRPIVTLSHEAQEYLTNPQNTGTSVDTKTLTQSIRPVSFDKGNTWIHGPGTTQVAINDFVIMLQDPRTANGNPDAYVLDFSKESFQPFLVGQQFTGRLELKNSEVDIKKFIPAAEFKLPAEKTREISGDTKQRALRLVQ